jgi:hypothetical protein
LPAGDSVKNNRVPPAKYMSNFTSKHSLMKVFLDMAL